MIRSARRRALALPLSAIVLLGSGFAWTAGPQRDIAVSVEFGTPVGPAELLESLRLAVLRELEASLCFTAVRGADAADASLALRLTLQDYEELVDYGASIAARSQAYDPNVERLLVARFRLNLDARLTLPAESLTVRSYRASSGRAVRPGGPLSLGEEWAREEARNRTIEELVEAVLQKTCKGGPAKLEKRIDKARRQAG